MSKTAVICRHVYCTFCILANVQQCFVVVGFPPTPPLGVEDNRAECFVLIEVLLPSMVCMFSKEK